MNLPQYCLLPLLLLVVIAHARPQKRSDIDYFDDSPYTDEGIAIDFVTIPQTTASTSPPTTTTSEPKTKSPPVGDVRTNRINSFMSTLSSLNDSTGVVQWLRSVW